MLLNSFFKELNYGPAHIPGEHILHSVQMSTDYWVLSLSHSLSVSPGPLTLPPGTAGLWAWSWPCVAGCWWCGAEFVPLAEVVPLFGKSALSDSLICKRLPARLVVVILCCSFPPVALCGAALVRLEQRERLPPHWSALLSWLFVWLPDLLLQFWLLVSLLWTDRFPGSDAG